MNRERYYGKRFTSRRGLIRMTESYIRHVPPLNQVAIPLTCEQPVTAP